MAYKNVDTVPASGGTSDMTSPVLLYNAAGTPSFIRNSPTQWAYAWDTSGRITGISATGGGPAVPGGCVVSG